MKTWHDVPGAIELRVDGHAMARLTCPDRAWIARWSFDSSDAGYIGSFGNLATAKREVAAAFDTLSALYT